MFTPNQLKEGPLHNIIVVDLTRQLAGPQSTRVLADLGAKVITFNAGNGVIKAFDATSGKTVWAKPQSYPATSGMLATAGGLVFYGDPEGRFNALNDETGEHLWAFNVGSSIHGNPTTFITGVGLYNSSGQLLAIATLSKPLKKNFEIIT